MCGQKAFRFAPCIINAGGQNSILPVTVAFRRMKYPWLVAVNHIP